jgi:hypothetical protein
MGQIDIVMKHEKSTKNTEKYTEVVVYGEQALIGSQYIQKSAFKDDGNHPNEINISVTWD